MKNKKGNTTPIKSNDQRQGQDDKNDDKGKTLLSKKAALLLGGVASAAAGAAIIKSGANIGTEKQKNVGFINLDVSDFIDPYTPFHDRGLSNNEKKSNIKSAVRTKSPTSPTGTRFVNLDYIHTLIDNLGYGDLKVQKKDVELMKNIFETAGPILEKTSNAFMSKLPDGADPNDIDTALSRLSLTFSNFLFESELVLDKNVDAAVEKIKKLKYYKDPYSPRKGNAKPKEIKQADEFVNTFIEALTKYQRTLAPEYLHQVPLGTDLAGAVQSLSDYMNFGASKVPTIFKQNLLLEVPKKLLHLVAFDHYLLALGAAYKARQIDKTDKSYEALLQASHYYLERNIFTRARLDQPARAIAQAAYIDKAAIEYFDRCAKLGYLDVDNTLQRVQHVLPAIGDNLYKIGGREIKEIDKALRPEIVNNGYVPGWDGGTHLRELNEIQKLEENNSKPKKRS